MSESPYNLTLIREVLGSGDPDGVLLGAVAGMLPDEPNVSRVRRTGGTENELGEFVGFAEEVFDFRALVAPVDYDARHTAAGEFLSGDITAAWLHDEAEGQVLEIGDRVLWNGEAYDVEKVQVPEMDSVADFYSAVLRRQSD